MSALCLIALSTQAATITVTNINDGGAGSLRQAIADANDGDTIDLKVTGSITLTTGELLVDKQCYPSGPGASTLAVDGNQGGSVFHVSGGVTAAIACLTITRGDGDIGVGGGGGIYNDHATLAVDSCTVSGNRARAAAGGVFNDGFNGSATLTVSNSTFSGNWAAAPYGAGNGGAIYNGSATLTVTNSTFSGNFANLAGPSGGGAIFNDGDFGSATLTLNNSTFSGNSAYQGGAIYNRSATVTIRDTILNCAELGENLYNSSGSVSSLGYNLSNDNGGGFGASTYVSKAPFATDW